MTIFEISSGEAAFTDDDSMRNSHELRIGEFDPRAGVAIVEQHVDAGGIELLIQGIGGLLDARHADSVAAHEHGQCLSLLVQYACIHGLAVQLPELKYVAHLDAARDLKGPAATWARIAALRVANIDGRRVLQIALQIDAAEVCVLLVGAADEVSQVGRGKVDVDRAPKTDGPDEAGFRTGGSANAIAARHAQRDGNRGPFLRLHGVQFMVASDLQSDHAAAGAVSPQGFDAAGRIDAELCAELRNGARI